MTATSDPETVETDSAAAPVKTRRWKRIFRNVALAAAAVILIAGYLLRDHFRTLQSLRRVPGTNAYVMDYYVDYHVDQIRASGVDVDHVEDSFMAVFFPDWMLPIAIRMKSHYLIEEIVPLPAPVERCSTVTLHTSDGKMFFGRNLDWKHDALLILKIHNGDSVASVSVIDLHYLNLDRDDLELTSLIQRIPLLFAPYYLQDGMNRHGVAVSDMSVEGVKLPFDESKPNIIHSTAMRLILDYATSLDDAIAILQQFNVHFVETTCHLMIADAAGKSAVVEYIDGKIEVTPAAENWQVCTNHQIRGKTEEENDQCCDRYHTASDGLAELSAAGGADDVMQIMESVSKEGWTMWSSVYNLTDREFCVAYRRHFDKPYLDRLGN
jgi:hypothetical protein